MSAPLRLYTPLVVDVEAITAENVSLLCRIHVLEDETTRCHAALTQNYHLLIPSPIRRLPIELHHFIFDLACANVAPNLRPAVVISAVCYHWRNIALSSPHLWTSIFCSEDTKPKCVHVYLERSAGKPLAITVEFDDLFYDRDENYKPINVTPTQLAMLLAESKRWISADLFVSEDGYRYDLDTMGNGESFPLLEYLYFRDTTYSSSHTAFSAAPRLHTVSILEMNCRGNSCIPWVQLEHLIFEDFGDDSDYEAEYVSLPPPPGRDIKQKLSLSGSVNAIAAEYYQVPLLMHCTSILLDGEMFQAFGLMCGLRIPQLEELSIVIDMDRTTQHHIRPFMRFLARSECSIHSFSILAKIFKAGGPNSPSLDIKPLLRALGNTLRTLKVLEHIPSIVNGPLFSYLTDVNQLPKLTTLELAWSGVDSWDDLHINMAITRGPRLRSLVVGPRSGDVRPNLPAVLSDLRARGVQAMLYHGL